MTFKVAAARGGDVGQLAPIGAPQALEEVSSVQSAAANRLKPVAPSAKGQLQPLSPIAPDEVSTITSL